MSDVARWCVWGSLDGSRWYVSPRADGETIGFATWREAYAYASSVARA